MNKLFITPKSTFAQFLGTKNTGNTNKGIKKSILLDINIFSKKMNCAKDTP